MFGQIIRNFTKKLFRQATTGNSRRKPLQRKLQVEALESRELMAAGLSAHLSQNILTIDATPQADKIILRESQNRIAINGLKQSFDVRKVKQIVVEGFESNDTIRLDGGAAAGRQKITIPTFRHWSNGQLQRLTPAGAWKTVGNTIPGPVSTPIPVPAPAPGNENGGVTGPLVPLPKPAVESHVSPDPIDPAPFVPSPGNSVPVDPVPVPSVASYSLGQDGWLYVNADGSSHLIDATPVQAIVSAGPSSVFVLETSNRLVLLNADGSSHLIDATPVQAIVSAGPSSVFVLETSNRLVLLNADGSSHLIDATPVQAIVSAGPSSVFVLETSNRLVLLNADGSSHLIDATPVQAIVSAGPSSVFVLETSNRLVLLNADGSSHLIDATPVQTIVSAGPSSALVRETSNRLVLLNADGSSHLIEAAPVQLTESALPSWFNGSLASELG